MKFSAIAVFAAVLSTANGFSTMKPAALTRGVVSKVGSIDVTFAALPIITHHSRVDADILY